jgi:hypothetical protein
MQFSFKTVRTYAQLYQKRNYPLCVAYQLAWSIVKFNQAFNAQRDRALIEPQYFVLEFYAEKYGKVITRIGKKVGPFLDNVKLPRHLVYFDLLRQAERTAIKTHLRRLQIISEAEAHQRVQEIRETKNLVTNLSQAA